MCWLCCGAEVLMQFLSISQFCHAALFSFIKENALFKDQGAFKYA
jgi:hypothetical protein